MKVKRDGMFLAVCFLAVATCLVSFLWSNVILLAILLLFESTIMLAIWRTKNDRLSYVICAIIGPSIEVVAIHFGAWNYSASTAFGMPLWLPVLYGIAGVSLNRITKALGA